MSAHARLEVVATDAGERVLVARAGSGSAEAEMVAHIVPADFGSTPHMEAAAGRLAACWNLCIGIPDDTLEACAEAQHQGAPLDALARAAGHHVVATHPSVWHG